MNGLRNSLNKQGLGMLIGLIVQYLLGISTNLFVRFPPSGNEGVMWQFAKSQLLFNLHLYWGTLLLIGAIVFYIRAFRQKNKSWKIASGFGLAFIIFAIVAGILFVGNQKDIYSFVMAFSFLASFISYGWGLYKTR